MTTTYPEIELRYFPVRGRGQFIRALLHHRQVPFSDHRILLSADLSSWQETRQDRALTGPFQKMPALAWGKYTLNETLVIMGFIHEQLGDAALLDEETNLRHAMLTSSAFLDLLTPCVNLVWAEIFNPGVDLKKACDGITRRLAMHLQTLELTLKEWQWLDGMGKRPVMAADAMLWEALDVLLTTFSGHIGFGQHAALNGFYRRCPGADSFRELLIEHPAPVTACPLETAVLEKLREYTS